MNTCTHKPTQEVYIIMGGKSFYSIIYIMPAAIPINTVSHTHTHTYTHTPTERHTQKNTLANINWDVFRTVYCVAKTWILNAQIFQLNFIPATPMVTIRFYNFMPLSVTFTFAAPIKTCQLYFLAHFSTGWDRIWCGGEAIQFEYSIVRLLLNEITLRNQGKELLFNWLFQETLTLACIRVFN